MSIESQWPRQICTLETMSRGDALRAGMEWSMQHHGTSAPHTLPLRTAKPAWLEAAWHERVELFASLRRLHPVVADLELRQNYVDFLSHLKVVLDDLTRDCRQLPPAKMIPLAHFGGELCGWSRAQIIEMVNEYHQDSCRRCSTR